MAIVIEASPQNYQSAHDDLYYVVYEATKATDPVTYLDYKYVADIYINGVLVATQKTVPHPVTKRGIFNIFAIVKSYVGLSFTPGTGFFSQENSIGDFYNKVFVKFGEEYTGVLYTNLVTSTEKAFMNYYNERRRDMTQQVGANMFLSSRPLLNNKVRKQTEYLFLPFLKGAIGDIVLTIEVFYKNGTSVNNSFTYAVTGEFNMVILNIAPAVVTSNGLTINDNTTYYTVAITGSHKYRFDIYCEAINTPYMLHFMNRYGGVESFEFPKLSRRKLNLTQKSIGVLKADLIGNNFSGIITNPSHKTYATTYGEKLELNSGNIKEGQYKWLSQLVLSPLKWIEEHGQLVPVKLTNTDYTFKTSVNDKASSFLAVEVDYVEVLKTQSL